jgi:hypothetical protein
MARCSSTFRFCCLLGRGVHRKDLREHLREHNLREHHLRQQ